MAAELDKSTHDVPSPERTGAARSEYIGLVLGERYRLLRPLGHGGMGSVYFAEHALLGKPLAVKVLDSRYVKEAHGAERLFREARAAAAIGHPNIIDVVDVGLTPFDDPYLVMEYLEGEDLANYGQRQAPLSCAMACAILAPILEALAAAHAKGIVHRDIKPANIFLVERPGYAPVVKLIDFGIAKTLGGTNEPQITVNGALLGTPSYMSPEQARGSSDVDERADLYAVGVVFYQLLTGHLPFDGSNYNETIYKILNDSPQLDSGITELPEDAASLIRKAICKDPAERYQSAEQMLRAVQLLWGWSERDEALAEVAASLRTQCFEALEATNVGPTPSTVVSPHFHGGDRRGAVIDTFNTRVEGSNVRSPKASPTSSSGITANLEPTRASLPGPSPRLEPSSDGASTDKTAPPAPPADGGRTSKHATPGSASEQHVRQRRLAWLSLVLAGALIGLLALARSRPGQNQGFAEADAPTSSTVGTGRVLPKTTTDAVTITVVGVPHEATISVDGEAVSDNPFTVPRSDELVTVSVELDGFERFSAGLVPSRDIALSVKLTPKPQASAPAPSEGAPKRPSLARPRAPQQDPIGKSGRDSLYYEKFE